jgi:hypothetical protein
VCDVDRYYNMAENTCTQCSGSTSVASIAVSVIAFLIVIAVIGYLLLRFLHRPELIRNAKKAVIGVASGNRVLSMKLKINKKDGDEEAAGRSASETIPFDEPVFIVAPTAGSSLRRLSSVRNKSLTDRAGSMNEEAGNEGSLQSKFKIIVAMYQIITSFPWTLRLNFPPVYAWFLSILSFFNLDLVNMIPVGCMFATNFLASLLITTISPILVSIAIYLFKNIWNESIRKAEYKKRTPTIEVNKMIRTSNDMFFQLFLLWTFIVFPRFGATFRSRVCLLINMMYLAILRSVCTKIFRGLRSCHRLDNGKSYMYDDYSIECGSMEHDKVLGVAYGMMVVYAIGGFICCHLVFSSYGVTVDRLRHSELLPAAALHESRADCSRGQIPHAADGCSEQGHQRRGRGGKHGRDGGRSEAAHVGLRVARECVLIEFSVCCIQTRSVVVGGV